MISAYQKVLLVSLENNYQPEFIVRADICVFGFGELDGLRDNHSIALMIEEMTLPEPLIFHTIKSNIEHFQSSADLMKHNLRLLYRSIFDEEIPRITDWVFELRGYPRASARNIPHSEWEHDQNFMFLLSIGHSEKEASLMLQHKPWSNFP
jgi:hypothetical protein